MRRFLSQFRDKIIGVIDGFDRIVFRGWLSRFRYAEGMRDFLANQQVMLKDFEPFAKTLTDALRRDAEVAAGRLHGKVHYLPSPTISKESVALKYMAYTQGPLWPDLRALSARSMLDVGGPAIAHARTPAAVPAQGGEVPALLPLLLRPALRLWARADPELVPLPSASVPQRSRLAGSSP